MIYIVSLILTLFPASHKQQPNVSHDYMVSMSDHYANCEANNWKGADCQDDDRDVQP